MPRLIHSTPKYRHHRASGNAVVKIQGKDHYLGTYGTKASKAKYDRLIAEWLAAGRAIQPPEATQLTIAELIVAYWRHVTSYYVKNGSPTAEQDCMKSALRTVRRLYGNTPAIKFGPIALGTVRQAMIEEGLARSTINNQIHRIRRMFRWATKEEMLPPSVLQALLALSGLQRGRTTAREPSPILPVSDDVIGKTLVHLPSVVADIVRFQRLTGCRPDEVCSIRPIDVDTSCEVWQYIPEEHKTEHHGKQRTIFIGPKAQDVLRPYLLRPEECYCFCPAESERKRLSARHDARQTPLQYGNRPGTNRVHHWHRQALRERYYAETYRRCIERACDKAFPPAEKLTPQKLKEWQKEHRWAPNRLRHTAATELRKQFGLEAAQIILGHSNADVTQIYAERDLTKATAVIREVGFLPF